MTEAPLPVVIDGVSVDINDPCAYCRALRAYRTRLALGGVVEEIEVQSPLTRRRTKFKSGSNVSDLDDLIEEQRALCAASIGDVRPTRTRFAGRGRMLRPY